MSVSLIKPGHYRPGADTNHFLGRCEECDAHYLAGMTLGRVQDFYHAGGISQVAYEAFMLAWTTSAVRYVNYGDWSSDDPAVIRMADAIRAAYEARKARAV